MLANRAFRSSVIIFCGLLLNACNIFGGDDPAPASAGVVQGQGVKGLIRNADVTLCEFPATSLEDADCSVIGTGSTSDAGVYSVTLGTYGGGPVKVQIKGRSATADPRTMVKCDVQRPGTTDDCGTGIAFGSFYNVTDTFVMTSLIPQLDADGDSRINSNALTSAALSRARQLLALGGIDSRTAVLRALSQLSQLAGGTNIINTFVPDLTAPGAADSPQGKALAGLITSLYRKAIEAETADGDFDVEPSALLATALTDYETKFGDGKISAGEMRELVNEARDQLRETYGADEDGGGSYASLQNQADTADPDGDGLGDIEPVADEDFGNTDIEAAKALVADLRDLVNNTAETLDDPSSAFRKQIEMAFIKDGKLDKEVDDGLEVAFLVARVIVACYNSDTFNKKGNCPNGTAQRPVAHLGNATFAISGGTEPNDTVTVQVTGTVRGDNGVNLTYSGPRKLTFDSTKTATYTGTVTDPNGASFELVTGNMGYTGGNANGTELNISAATVSTIARITSKGTVFEGEFGLGLVRCTSSACVSEENSTKDPIINLASVVLRGKFSSGDDQAQIAVSVTAENATAEKQSRLESVKGTLVVSLTAKLKDAKDVAVTATFVSAGSSSGEPKGKVTLVMNQGGNIFIILGDNTGENLVVTVTSDDGAILTIREGGNDPVIGTITFNTKEVATVEKRSRNLIVIKYADGTFESVS